MLNHALDTIAASLSTALQDLKFDVVKHEGRFSVEDLGRYSLKPRTLVLSIVQVRDIQTTGLDQATLVFSAFVVVGKDKARSVVAMDAVNRLLNFVPFQRFGSDRLRPALPKDLDAKNMFNGKVGSQGVALWLLSWKQPIKYVTH